MSGTANAGVSIRVGVDAQGVREQFQAIGQAGQQALGGIAQASEGAERSTVGLQRAFARTQAVLDPASAAAEKYERQIRNIAAAEAAGIATAERAAQLRQAAQQQYAQAAQVAQAASSSMVAANNAAAVSAGQLRGAVGTLGFQVQDLVTQISMGQNALLAFATQFGQLAGFFGGAGAAAGIAVTLAAIAANTLLIGDNSAEARRKAEEGFNGIRQAAEELKKITEEVNDLFLTQEQRAQRAAFASRQELEQRIRTQQGIAAARIDDASIELLSAEQEVARLRRRVPSPEAQAAIDANRERQRRAGVMVPNEDEDGTRSLLFSAEARVQGLRQTINQASEALRRLGTDAEVLAGDLPLPPPFTPEDADRPARAARGTRQASEGAREYQGVIRDLEGQIERTRSEDERWATTVARLNELQAQGTITASERDRALELREEATRRQREQQEQRDRDRAAEQQRREAERETDRLNRQADAFIGRYSADLARGTVDALWDGFEKGKGFGQSMAEAFSRSLRNLAQAALDALVFRPLLQGAANALGFGSPVGAVSGASSLFGGGSGGGILGMGGAASGASSLYRSVTNFNPGAMMSGGYQFGTGFGAIDGILNTPLWGAGQGAATNAALGAMGAGVYGPATPAAVSAAGGNALSVGNLGMGALGVAGGLYGVYSGIQKGGVGGFASAAGGALGAGLSAAALAGLAVPGVGWIAAAVLSVLGMILPGQKPSNKAQWAVGDFAGGDGRFDGLSSNGRFSQENADEAKRLFGTVQGIASNMEKATGLSAAGQFRVTVSQGRSKDDPGSFILESGRDFPAGQPWDGTQAEGLNQAVIPRTEQGAQQLVKTATDMVARAMIAEGERTGNQSFEFKALKAAQGDFEKASKDIEWYRGVYKPLVGDLDAVTFQSSEFGKQLQAIHTQYDTVIARARELQLATGDLERARDREMGAMQRQKDLTLATAELGLRSRIAGGDPAALRQIALMQQSYGFAQEAQQFEAQLRSLGVAAGETARLMGMLADAQRADVQAQNDNVRRGYNASMYDALGLGYVNQAIALRRQYEAEAPLLRELGKNPETLFQARMKQFLDGLPTDQLFQLSDTLSAFDADMAGIAKSFGEARRATESLAEAQQRSERLLSAGGSIRAFLDAQNATAGAAVSPEDALAESRRLFARDLGLAGAGDLDALGRITGAAGTVLQNAQGFFGSTEGFQGIRNEVLSGLAGLPAVRGYDAQMAGSLAQIEVSTGAANDNLALFLASVTGAGGASLHDAIGAGNTIAADVGNAHSVLLADNTRWTAEIVREVQQLRAENRAMQDGMQRLVARVGEVLAERLDTVGANTGRAASQLEQRAA